MTGSVREKRVWQSSAGELSRQQVSEEYCRGQQVSGNKRYGGDKKVNIVCGNTPSLRIVTQGESKSKHTMTILGSRKSKSTISSLQAQTQGVKNTHYVHF